MTEGALASCSARFRATVFGELFLTFTKGWLIVSLVAWNTRHIARLDYDAAFLTGWAVSYIWWDNSRTAAKSTVRGARYAYAFGAGLGTITGMWLGR